MAIANLEQTRDISTRTGGLSISIRTGSGQGSTLLSAFDNALMGAGVADFNLVTLSSVIPASSQIRTVNAALPGEHGDLLYCVRAEAFTDQPGETAWAGLGWCVDSDGAGLFVEHHGETEDSVVDQIHRSLQDMNATRGHRYGPVNVAISSARCLDKPACALVLAAYRVTSWKQSAADQTPQQPQEHSTWPPPRTMIDSAPRSQVAPAPTLNGAISSEPLPSRPPVVSAGTASHRPSVTVEKELDYATARRYYQLYRSTFGELETQAVARQLLHESEFLEEMVNPHIQKYVARDDQGEAIGLSTLTTHLDSVPWISPGYFAHHYPEEWARQAVFYVGFTLVDPAHRGARTFHAMFRPMIEQIVAAKGVVAWDLCLANEERGLLGSGSELMREYADLTVEPIDRQSYYAARLHRARTPPTTSGTRTRN